MSLRHAAITGLLGALAAAGAAVAVTFRYATNGRGPKARSRIEPDARAADMKPFAPPRR